MLVPGFDRGGLAEVHLDRHAHDLFAIQDLPYPDCGVLVHEGDNDTTEGLEGRPDVDRGGCVDQLPDGLEVVRAEDLRFFEVRDEQRVRGRTGRG